MAIEAELLRSLDDLAQRQRRTRSEIILDACRAYVRSRRALDTDALYRRAYRRIPESSSVGEVQVLLALAVLPEETW
ncbi:MAG: hypothetical protein K6U89_20075 [Chloroflexi bacterium]|nr:hypothetical protein [Chloroflexota bacterium]